MLHHLPEGWAVYFNNYYKYAQVIGLSVITRALPEDQKGQRRPNLTPFLYFQPQNIGIKSV